MDIVVLELIKALQIIDNKNEYYILVKPDIDSGILQETPNFKIIEIPGSSYPLWEQFSLPKVIKKIKPDIVHCTSNTAPITSKFPLIITLHDILYMRHIDFTKGSWYQRLGNLYRRWNVPQVINKCEKIITVSKFEKEEIEEYFSLPPGQVEVIYNSPSTLFKPIQDRTKLEYYRQKYRLPQKFVFYLGNTHPNKNIRNVLKALSMLNQENEEPFYIVMPDIEKDFLGKILQEIGDHQLKEYIFLTGYIPNHELPYLYNLSEVFLYPSFYESFGIPILESMACGTPVITSNTAAMPEVSNGHAYIVDPRQADEIKSAIMNIYSRSAKDRPCAIDQIHYAKNFSWEKTASRVLKLYEEVYTSKRTTSHK